MHSLTLKSVNPSFFRPTSQPSSPAPVPPSHPDSGIEFERTARPMNKLSLSPFRRASPAPSPAATSASMTTLTQDGSYLEMLSLKLSEAVSKALAQPPGPAAAHEQVSGKRPIPTGRGRALGALIASELKATRDNAHLHRALLRCLHRPLSVMITNLSAHLLLLISTSAFLAPPTPTPQASTPNPTQLHALAIADFAGELLETFDELNLGVDSDPRGDGLKSIREGLLSIVGKVINPLIDSIKSELVPLIRALENPATIPAGSVKTTATGGSKLTVVQHPSISALQIAIPVYSKALTRYTASATSQASLASLLISVLWRGLVALSNRPQPPPSPPASPAIVPAVSKTQRQFVTTPPVSPPSARFTIKLPPSRPPSPPSAQVPSTAAADARALYDLLSHLPRPVAAHHLAREAVDEAYDGLKALAQLLEVAQANSFTKNKQAEVDYVKDLEALTADLPTLIALPVVLRAHSPTSSDIASMIGLSEQDYRSGCLHGFSRAEECAGAVGQRVLDVLATDMTASGSSWVATKWLEHKVSAADD